MSASFDVLGASENMLSPKKLRPMVTPLRLAAILDDLIKCLVERDVILVLIHERAHGMADMNVFGKDDKSVLRAMP